MLQLMIAILLGLACPTHTSTITNNGCHTVINQVDPDDGTGSGGEDGQLPPPPIQ